MSFIKNLFKTPSVPKIAGAPPPPTPSLASPSVMAAGLGQYNSINPLGVGALSTGAAKLPRKTNTKKSSLLGGM